MKKSSWQIILALLFVVPASALEIGEKAPEFSATSVTGNSITLKDFLGKVVVLEWFNRGCPFVQKHYQNGEMQKLQEEFVGKGAVWLTINSTNKDHTDYLDLDQTKKVADEWKIKSSDYLIDSSGKIGKKYSAKTTPHMFIINERGVLIYQGAIDDNPDPYADPKTSLNYVKKALDEHFSAKPIAISETKAYGCSVKY